MSTTKQHITTETCKVSHGIGICFSILIKLWIAISGGSCTWNPVGFEYLQKYHGEKGWTRLFFIFCHIWWFSKGEQTKGTAELWKIIKYAKNVAKKIKEKPCSNCLQPIFWLILKPENRISSTRFATNTAECRSFSFWDVNIKDFGFLCITSM